MYMRAIIFDMDGTLLDSEGYWTRAPLVLLRAAGHPLVCFVAAGHAFV